MTARSAVDSTYRFFHWSVVALISALLAFPEEGRIPGLILMAAVLLFLFWLYFGTWYELREDHLYVRSGPFREKIPYDRIRRLERVMNSFSSMALSRDRIGIWQYGRGFITGTTYISPVDPDVFFAALEQRCTNLETDAKR